MANIDEAAAPPPRALATPPLSTGERKRAVVLIHGMGEQVPMATLRGFVDAVWTSNAGVIGNRPDGDTGRARVRNPVWFKPDERNHSYELHRITTEFDEGGVRTDFYEYYWAHLMHGSTWEQVVGWIRNLLLRSPINVPYGVFHVWLTAWAIVALFVLLIAALAWWRLNPWVAAVAAALALAAPVIGKLRPSLRRTLVAVVGDVARYVEPYPPNVARRQEIRERGVALLERLMGVNAESIAANRDRIRKGEPLVWKRDYEEIIVVGHSLGTIIGYDILKHAFARINTLVGVTEPKPALRAIELYCRKMRRKPDQFAFDCFSRLQTDAAKELVSQGSPWIVSRFVTLGSPLTHAEFLMAESHDDLRDRQASRVLPICPPVMEWDANTKVEHFSYPSPFFQRSASKRPKDNAQRVPHHAAHFGFTRWTNLHSPHSWVLRGDLVSGPVSATFGLPGKTDRTMMLGGALDIELAPDPGTFGPWLTHIQYWRLARAGRLIPEAQVPRHIAELRRAIGL
jgi:hypothetical protein